MRKATLIAGVLALGVMVVSAVPALANLLPNQPKILLHVATTTTKNACTTWFTTTAPTCSSVVVQGNIQTAPGAGPFYFVYLVAVKGDSMPNLAGLQCGLDYQTPASPATGATDQSGLDIFSWTLCATLEFQTPAPRPLWPNPKSGNLITWDSSTKCQTGELANAGYFYCGAYSPDTFFVINRPVDNLAKVADCLAREANPLPRTALGFVGFGGQAGCNPCLEGCGGVPVEPTTWGSIKSLYRK